MKDASESGKRLDPPEQRTVATPIRLTARTYALCAALNFFRLGYDLGGCAIIGPWIQESFDLTNQQLELFLGWMSICSVVSVFAQQQISDGLGRRSAFAASAVSNIIGQGVMVSSATYTTLMVGRTFVGVSLGLGVFLDTVYITELAPTEHRGTLVNYGELGQLLGVLFGYGTKLFVLFTTERMAWEVVCIFSASCSLLILVGTVLVLPESPRWLALHNREDEARQVLQSVYPEGFDVEPQILEIKKAAQRELLAEKSFGWSVLLCPSPAMARILLLGWSLPIVVQLAGCEAIIYYCLYILESAEISSEAQQSLIMIGLTIAQFLASIVSGYFLDVVGRRPILLRSLAGMQTGLSLLIVSSYVEDTKYQSCLALSGLLLVFSGYGYGLGPVGTLLPSEVFPTGIRAKAMTIVNLLHGIFSFLVVGNFLSLKDNISWPGVLALMLTVLTVSSAFYYFYLIETKGKKLEDMLLIFAKITGDFSVLEAEGKLELLELEESKGKQDDDQPRMRQDVSRR